jgi:Crinkler effector protein N-terminal domain
MGNDTITFLYYLKGDHHIFTIDNIDKNKTIDYLKKSIKEELRPDLDHVNATDIDLYEVPIPTTLREAYIQIENQKPLDPVNTIDEVFPSPAKKHIHVIVKVPGKLLPLIAIIFNPPPNTSSQSLLLITRETSY